jgi:hypothetical protein
MGRMGTTYHFLAFVPSHGAAVYRGADRQNGEKEPAAKKPERTELQRVRRASRRCFSQSVEAPASDQIGSMLGAG